MQHAGGMLLPPVQTLVATIIFALRAKMQIESYIVHRYKINVHLVWGIKCRVWAIFVFAGLAFVINVPGNIRKPLPVGRGFCYFTWGSRLLRLRAGRSAR